VAGCVVEGDFGRLRPELGNDDIHTWIGRDAVGAIGLPPSQYPLTDDERTLRDLAYPLIEPSYKRDRWDAVLREYGFTRTPPEAAIFNPATYWFKINETGRRSEASAYAQIITDARDDVVRLEPFFAVAHRVADMDARRAKSLAFVRALSEAERDNALNRNNENAAVVAWVCHRLGERATSYGYALERLVLAAPSAKAVEAERSLTLLRTRIGHYCQRAASGRIVSKG
jgi:hypothetical protein